MNIISSKSVTSRKPHRCWGCTDNKPIGSILQRVVCRDSGEIYNVYWCVSCWHFLIEHQNDFDPWKDGFGFGELRYEMELGD